jgi:hypothetical protein
MKPNMTTVVLPIKIYCRVQHNAASEVKPAVKACRDLATVRGGEGGSAGQLTQYKMHTSDTFCYNVGIADYI